MRSTLLATGMLPVVLACHHAPQPMSPATPPAAVPPAPAPAAAPAPMADMPMPAATVPADTAVRGQAAAVRFMQGMIGHHAQALAMVALVRDRTPRQDLRLVAERIDVSQRDEIGLMQRWLRAHGADAPEPMPAEHQMMGHMGAAMPGMLTAEQMQQLAAATGPAFERRFLEGMIQHHEGALVMVRTLFAAGGTEAPEVYRLASDVEADQRAEIARMKTLLARMP